MLAFSRTPADVVLLETGLGGRLDSTNVIERPAVTALTRISYDHMQFLGGTLTEIAGEKAGIMRPGVPSVVAPQPSSEVTSAFRERAASIGAPLCMKRASPGAPSPMARASALKARRARPTYRCPPCRARTRSSMPAWRWPAWTICRASRFPMKRSAGGLAEVRWPGRLQRLTRGPLVDRLPPGWDLWLDGGHNDSAGEVLGAQAARWRETDGLPLKLIFGMLATKEPKDFLRPLSGFASSLRAVAIPGEEASLTPEDAASAARAVGIQDAEAVASVDAALDALIQHDPRPTRVMICGSLYLAGAVLARNG